MSHAQEGHYGNAKCREKVPDQEFFCSTPDTSLGVAYGEWRASHFHLEALHSADTASKLRGFLADKMQRNGHCTRDHDWTDREGNFHLVIDRETMTFVYPIKTSSAEAICSAAGRPAEQDEEEMEMERAIFQLLEKIYELDKTEDKRRSAAKVVFTFVERNFASRDLRAIHRLMARMDIGKMSELSLVGLIRATSRAKNFLPLWGRTLQKTRKALEARGLDHRGLLMGIRQVG